MTNERNNNIAFAVIAVMVTISAIVNIFILETPNQFPVGLVNTISEGSSVNEIATALQKNHVIRSSLAFRLILEITRQTRTLKAGDYLFDHPINLLEVTKRISNGKFGLEPVRVTIYEGTSNVEIARQLSDMLTDFDPFTFLQKSRDLEGYLFPDTYFFLPNVSAEVVIETMHKNFDSKIADVQPLIDGVVTEKGVTLNNIITLASVIEKEASREVDRRLISGVMWNRLDINMPLQVDATLSYIMGRNTYNLTLNDLAFDSPYNTYKYKGLPPAPITNPGISSIMAALQPEPSDYLYYLSDKIGNTYYAKDFATHKVNKAKYVK